MNRYSVALGALAVTLGLCSRGLVSAQTATPSPSPVPSPTASPTPSATIGGTFTIFGMHTAGTNATGTLDQATGADIADRADISNALLNASAGSGRFRASATVGTYNFLTVGQAINPTTQTGSNTMLYSVVPVGQVQYTLNGHWSLAAGKFAALLGQESPFTYQNLNIERGLGWAIEPAISRGAQAAYTNGPFSATVQLNDAYYSGHNRAFEYLIGWAPSASTNVQFAAIVPGANTPGNPTSAIGNKSEYDLMYTRQIGRFQLLPYLLLVHSPSSTGLGYTNSENATVAVLLGSYAASPEVSVALRYESLRQSSSSTDTSLNADLIGYGPGSSAQTLTLTPALHFGYGVARLEYSRVTINSLIPGAGFGAGGIVTSQERFGFELGLQK